MEAIICPHCHYQHEDWWEYIDFEQDEQEFNMDCEDCGKEFYVNMYTTRTFNTSISE